MLRKPQSQHYWDWNVYNILVKQYQGNGGSLEGEASVRTLRPKRKPYLLQVPAWNMPSDPVKAVFWFLHWSLRVLVRFFYVLILGGVIFETILNGVVGLFGTLLVGLGVWTGLAALLLFVNVGTGVSRVVSDVGRMQKGFPPRSQFFNFTGPREPEGPIVEGTVTDLEEERRKRRQD